MNSIDIEIMEHLTLAAEQAVHEAKEQFARSPELQKGAVLLAANVTENYDSVEAEIVFDTLPAVVPAPRRDPNGVISGTAGIRTKEKANPLMLMQKTEKAMAGAFRRAIEGEETT